MSGCGTRIVLWGQKPLALCDRCPCFGSLFPPLAALTFAASSIICAFGLAAVAPRSPYRHLELCGIALSVKGSACSPPDPSCLPYVFLLSFIQYVSFINCIKRGNLHACFSPFTFPYPAAGSRLPGAAFCCGSWHCHHCHFVAKAPTPCFPSGGKSSSPICLAWTGSRPRLNRAPPSFPSCGIPATLPKRKASSSPKSPPRAAPSNRGKNSYCLSAKGQTPSLYRI